MKRLFTLLLTLLLTLSVTAAGADFPGMTGDVQAWLDAPPAMDSGVEWYILALSQTGSYDFAACRGALLEALTASSAPTTRLKYALVLLATGSQDPVIAETLAASAGQQGVMSHVYALHLMNNGVTAPGVAAEETVKTLLTLQCADGGWALRGTASDPDVTAMVLQALAPHRDNEAVRAACDRALERLSHLQRPEGCYASYGVLNPETTAQVLLALCEMGIDPLTDPRFIKEGHTLLDGIEAFRLPEGGYSHRLGDGPNANAATQVFFAMAGYRLFRAGYPGLYVLEIVPDTNPIARNHTTISWRVLAVGGILLGMVISLAALLLKGKRGWKNCLVPVAVAALLLLLVFTLDIRPADEYYTGELPVKPDAIGTVTLSIRCDAALNHPNASGLPADGVILPTTELPLASGDTVFTLLTEAAQARGFHLEAGGTTGMRYVQGIANLYEFSLGDLSGWLYFVNGESPSVGCDQLCPAPGDAIEFRYTLDLGGDVAPESP